MFLVFYWVPVSVTSQLKVVRVPVFAAAVSVACKPIEEITDESPVEN